MIATETSMEDGDDHKKSVTKDTTIYQHEPPKDTSQHNIETRPVTNSATTLGDEVTYSNVDMPSYCKTAMTNNQIGAIAPSHHRTTKMRC